MLTQGIIHLPVSTTVSVSTTLADHPTALTSLRPFSERKGSSGGRRTPGRHVQKTGLLSVAGQVCPAQALMERMSEGGNLVLVLLAKPNTVILSCINLNIKESHEWASSGLAGKSKRERIKDKFWSSTQFPEDKPCLPIDAPVHFLFHPPQPSCGFSRARLLEHCTGDRVCQVQVLACLGLLGVTIPCRTKWST